MREESLLCKGQVPFSYCEQPTRHAAAEAFGHDRRWDRLCHMRNDQVTIHTGDLAGRLLVDVLTEDLMEAA